MSLVIVLFSGWSLYYAVWKGNSEMSIGFKMCRFGFEYLCYRLVDL